MIPAKISRSEKQCEEESSKRLRESFESSDLYARVMKRRKEMEPQPDITETLKPEILDLKTVQEGMLLLGCVSDVKVDHLVMSLPGCLYGFVPIYVLEAFFNFKGETTGEEPYIFSVFKIGMVYPCKVIQIGNTTGPSIFLSINPDHVNDSIHSMYLNSVLYAAMYHIDNCNYILDTGTEKDKSEDTSKKLTFKGIIPTYFAGTDSRNTSMSNMLALNFNDDFPEVSAQNLELSSLLPGTKIRADVIKVKQPFIYMKYSRFYAYSSIFPGSEAVTEGTSVLGTVLYIHPKNDMIYLMLGSKPSPNFVSKLKLRMYSPVGDLKFLNIDKGLAYFKIENRDYGFIRVKNLPKLTSAKPTEDAYAAVADSLCAACVLQIHYMDKLVELTPNLSLVQSNYISPAEINIGEFYEVVVERHDTNRVCVSLSPTFCAFIPRILFPDECEKMHAIILESKYPVGCQITCRVISTDRARNNIFLTCKDFLLRLKKEYMISSYSDAKEGQFSVGVVSQVGRAHIHICFFNDIEGLAPTSHIPKGLNFFIGQSVICQVLKCDPSKKKLTLSVKSNDCDDTLNMFSDGPKNPDVLGMSQEEKKRFEGALAYIKKLEEQSKSYEEKKSNENPNEKQYAKPEKPLEAVLWGSPTGVPGCLDFSPKSDDVLGRTVKGYVKSITDTTVTVEFREDMHGNIYLGGCTNSDCNTCQTSKDAVACAYPLGRAIDVIVTKKSDDENSFILFPADEKIQQYCHIPESSSDAKPT